MNPVISVFHSPWGAWRELRRGRINDSALILSLRPCVPLRRIPIFAENKSTTTRGLVCLCAQTVASSAFSWRAQNDSFNDPSNFRKMFKVIFLRIQRIFTSFKLLFKKREIHHNWKEDKTGNIVIVKMKSFSKPALEIILAPNKKLAQKPVSGFSVLNSSDSTSCLF